jgi:hypothetical protein
MAGKDGKGTLAKGHIFKGCTAWVRIQKPVITYDIVTCDKKAACPDLLQCCQMFFIIKILPFLLNISDVIFEVEIQHLRS